MKKKMEKIETTLVPTIPIEEQGKQVVVKPALSTDQALAHFNRFQEIKDRVLTEGDKLPIKGKPYIRKSGWRKIKTMFNLTEEILHSNRQVIENEVIYTYRVRVKAPNGAFVDAEMSCSNKEPFGRGKPEAAVMAMAQTRAFNRAISDLVGGGEVSAEELEGVPMNGSSEIQITQPDAPVTEKQRKFLRALVNKKGITWDQVKARSITMFKKESSKDLTKGEISQLIDYYQTMPDQAPDDTLPESTISGEQSDDKTRDNKQKRS